MHSLEHHLIGCSQSEHYSAKVKGRRQEVELIHTATALQLMKTFAVETSRSNPR